MSDPKLVARIYVASSWRNNHQEEVVRELRESGFAVYDFKNPKPGDDGFNWKEIDPDWQTWDFKRYMEGLSHPIAQAGYAQDLYALDNCDACVLVLPCGRSAHLELGRASGKGKYCAIYHPPDVQVEPELMALMVDYQTNSFRALNYNLHTHFATQWRNVFLGRHG